MTPAFGGRYSIQLSYGRLKLIACRISCDIQAVLRTAGGTHAAARLPRPKPAGSGVRLFDCHVKWQSIAFGDRCSPN